MSEMWKELYAIVKNHAHKFEIDPKEMEEELIKFISTQDFQSWVFRNMKEQDHQMDEIRYNIATKQPEPTELEKAADGYDWRTNGDDSYDAAFEAGARWLAARLSDELIGLTEMGAEPTAETWGVARTLRKSILELTKTRD